MADEAELVKTFQWSVKNGELNEVKLKLAQEKSLVNKPMQGRCAIHYAADYGHTDVVELLIQHGADVNEPDKFGITPLLAAIFEKHTSTVDLLLKKGAKKGSYDGKSYLECAETDDIKMLLK